MFLIASNCSISEIPNILASYLHFRCCFQNMLPSILQMFWSGQLRRIQKFCSGDMCFFIRSVWSYWSSNNLVHACTWLDSWDRHVQSRRWECSVLDACMLFLKALLVKVAPEVITCALWLVAVGSCKTIPTPIPKYLFVMRLPRTFPTWL